MRAQGNTLLDQGDVAGACHVYGRACKAAPDDALSYLNWGYTLLELDDLPAAHSALHRAVALDGSQADGHFLLGQVLTRMARHSEAQQSLEAALSLQPEFDPARVNLAQALLAQDLYAQALAQVELVLARQPADADALHGKSNALHRLGRYGEALQACEAVLAIQPDFVEALCNAAAFNNELGRFEDSVAYCERALSIDAHYLPALYNLANTRLKQARYVEALAVCEQGLQLEPQEANLQWCRAQCLLLRGDMQAGWPAYESRWRAHTLKAKPLAIMKAKPQWKGEDLRGRSVLVHAEQGLGDTLHALRYVPLMVGRGATVYLRIPASLAPLCRGMPGCVVLDEAQADPPVDFQCPFLSLPLAMGTVLDNIPPPGDWIARDPALQAEWRARLGPRNAPRVGLAWSGFPGHRNDANRSIALAQLVRAIAPGWEMISLQKEVRPSDRAALVEAGVRDFGGQLRTFADTAALIGCVDLVVSVDTSIAHLAGVLGKPLWIMLPHVPDWRWMLDREDTPWYPGARLLRQGADRAWQPVLERVRADMAKALIDAPHSLNMAIAR